MPDIFVSYARNDQLVARWLVELLRGEGWDIWWDPDIVPGDRFDKEIQKQLTASRCVIVIWSKDSVVSRWVVAEANEGLEPCRLVPVSIGDVKKPLPFGEIQSVDLTDWRGDPAAPGYQKVLRAVRSMSERPVDDDGKRHPMVDSRRFSVVVAGIQNDIGGQLQDVIVTDLSAFEGVHVVTMDQTISTEGPDLEQSMKTAAEVAQDCLDNMQATIMIWGKVLRFAGREVPQLYLSLSRSKKQKAGRYLPTNDLRLPQVFWSDLTDVLRLVVLTYDIEFREQEGSYLGGQLRLFVSWVWQLLQSADQDRGWDDDALGLTRISLGNALMLLGSQSGENQPLEEAIASYRKALSELPRERSPSDWARAQNGLGISLWMLGRRQAGVELLNEAIASYQLALEERIRQREPLDWAQTYNDLGNALVTLGQRESGTDYLEEAISAYETALLERTVETKPLDWAQTQNNLGVALWRLGQRKENVARFLDAVEALQKSFKVYNRDKTPLDWSQTQNNLGLVFWTLGQKEGSSKHLWAAVGAFQQALAERTQIRVPLLWAQSQNNLGLAYWSLGQLGKDKKILDLAAKTFRSALCERTREKVPMDWAETQNNLGAVLWSIGQCEEGTKELIDAIKAYQEALKVYSSERGMALKWAETQHNLGNALVTLGERVKDVNRLKRALKCLNSAIRVYSRDREPMLWAQTQIDLGFAAYIAGEIFQDPKLFNKAANALEDAAYVYEQKGMTEAAGDLAQSVKQAQHRAVELEGTDDI